MTSPTGPTPYPELNGVLADLVGNAQTVLGDDLVGVYVHGSFAVGDADLYSDCDFLAPVRRPLTSVQEAGLRAFHNELPTRDGHWPHDIEGSYPVAEELRSLDGLGREWLFIDHGWREMVWSTHCNTEVARWALREHGITLIGPPAHTLVDPVPPEALRSRMRETIASFDDELATWMTLDIGWGQRYAVASHCRMLYTLETGEVCSKRMALEWAICRLDPRWVPLLRQVRDDRPRGYDPADPPPPGGADETRAFTRYTSRLATTW